MERKEDESDIGSRLREMIQDHSKFNNEVDAAIESLSVRHGDENAGSLCIAIIDALLAHNPSLAPWEVVQSTSFCALRKFVKDNSMLFDISRKPGVLISVAGLVLEFKGRDGGIGEYVINNMTRFTVDEDGDADYDFDNGSRDIKNISELLAFVDGVA